MELRKGDLSWDAFLRLSKGVPLAMVHVADAYDVTNILFSSGTTGTLDFNLISIFFILSLNLYK